MLDYLQTFRIPETALLCQLDRVALGLMMSAAIWPGNALFGQGGGDSAHGTPHIPEHGIGRRDEFHDRVKGRSEGFVAPTDCSHPPGPG